MEPKYITVRNWARYQGRIGKRGDIRRPFIKTAAALDSDPDFSQLTLVQRYVLEGCRRLMAVHGQNLPNDPLWVGRALCAPPEERHSVSRAVHMLAERGFLLYTNDKDPFSQIHNVTKRNDTILEGDDGYTAEPGISRPFEVED